MRRRAVVGVFFGAALWQFVFGAFSTVQLGAPGVGDRASWVPDLLIVQAVTLLPLGFAMAFLGTPAGRLLAALCAVVSLAMAIIAAMTLSSPQSSFLYAIPLLAVPGILLLVTATRARPSSGW